MSSLLTPREGLAVLHQHGLAMGIDDDALEKLTESAGLQSVLRSYYPAHPNEALHDGFVRVYIDADDPVGQLASTVGGEPLVSVVVNDDDDDDEILVVRSARGRVHRFDFFEPHSLADVAKVFNEELAHSKDPRRFFVLQHIGDTAFAFFLLPIATARALEEAGALAFEPLEG